MGSWLVYPGYHTAALRKATATPAFSNPSPDADAFEPASATPEPQTRPRRLPARLKDALAWSRQKNPHADVPDRGSSRQADEQRPIFLSLPSGLSPDADQFFPDEPPFPIQLSSAEIAELQHEGVVVATHYGPRQDKASNEDFALGGVIQVGRKREFAFVALADGVSTRTFWAARTARIACLTTYRTIQRLLEEGLDLGQAAAGPRIAEELAPAIEEQLKSDAIILEQAGVIPRDWSPETYEKYKADRRMWYRSTLLFGVAGDQGAVIGFAGDGGIRQIIPLERGAPRENTLLASEEGVELDHYVSLAFHPKEITTRHLPPTGRTGMHLIFATDGLDKTLSGLRPNDLRLGSRYLDLPLAGRKEAFAFLADIAGHKATDPDNLSVARLSWPLAGRSNPWPVRRQEPLARWQPAEPLGPLDAESTSPPSTAPHPSSATEPSRRATRGPRWAILLLTAALAACALAWNIVASREAAEDAHDTRPMGQTFDKTPKPPRIKGGTGTGGMPQD